MAYIDQYEKYLNEVEDAAELCRTTGKRAVFGYTSDLDIVLRYDAEAFGKLEKEYLITASDIYPESAMNDSGDFVRVMLHYLVSGDGGECDINDYGICEYLTQNFENAPGLGGTGAQGAAAMGAMEIPLIVHITDRSRPVCERMDYPVLDVIMDGIAVPVMEAVQDCVPIYHMIMEYSKGDTYYLAGEQGEVPLSNRLIMNYDQIHKDLPVNDDFRAYLEAHAESIVSYNISGLNAMLDPGLVRMRLQELDEHYRTMKEKNPDCIFYFESAHYLNPEVKVIVYEYFSRYVDIMGMNEDELVVHGRECGIEIDKNDLKDTISGVDLIRRKYGANGIILHTKDYSMYYGNELKGINIEKGLTLGNLMAGTRARTGHYGSREECRASLAYPLSGSGLRFSAEIEEMDFDCFVCLVPSRYIDHPKSTIGLGDTFSAGVQISFIR